MVLTTCAVPRFLIAMVANVVLTTTAYAQTTVPKSDTSKTIAMPYQSAFEGYRAYADELVADWKTANDTAARIGGWREYAKQAQSEVGTPPRPVVPETKPALKATP